MKRNPQDQQFRRTVRRLKYVVYAALLIGVAVQVHQWWNCVPRQVEPLPVYSRDDGAKSLRFLVVGDTGSGNKHQYAVAKAMQQKCEELRPNGIIMLGDNFIQEGVRSRNEAQWQTKIYEPYGRGCLEKVPIYAALGNHDYKGDITAQIRPPSTDAKWFMPHRYYQVTFGNLLNLVVTDTNTYDICGDRKSCVMDFMSAALDPDQHSLPWTLVASHHPIISSSGKYSKKEPVGWFQQKMLCGRAHGLLSGHSHHLEHMVLEECALDQIVAGGGGSFLYPIIPGKKGSRFAVSSYGYVVLDIDKDSLSYNYYDRDNKHLYSHSLNRAPSS